MIGLRGTGQPCGTLETDADKGRNRRNQQQGRQYPAQAFDPFAEIRRQQGGQRRGQNHAEQAETFSCCGQPGSQPGIQADVRPPGLIGHRGCRETDVGQRQRTDQPEGGVLRRRIEQRDEADGERHQGNCHHARSGDAVGQPAEPGIDAGVEQAGTEQDGAEQRQLHAGGFGVVMRHMYVDRQCSKGERQAEQSVGENVAGPHGVSRPGV
jgi:hypothetical protein